MGTVAVALISLPIAPINSPLWNVVTQINTEFKEEVGWPELVEKVAGIYNDLPAADKAQAGIFAGNYGEAGAISLYGLAYSLPTPISPVNSFWERGYGDPPPQVLVVVGANQQEVDSFFRRCDLVAHVTNRYGVENEETLRHPDIFLCRDQIKPWQEVWDDLQYFG